MSLLSRISENIKLGNHDIAVVLTQYQVRSVPMKMAVRVGKVMIECEKLGIGYNRRLAYLKKLDEM